MGFEQTIQRAQGGVAPQFLARQLAGCRRAFGFRHRQIKCVEHVLRGLPGVQRAQPLHAFRQPPQLAIATEHAIHHQRHVRGVLRFNQTPVGNRGFVSSCRRVEIARHQVGAHRLAIGGQRLLQMGSRGVGIAPGRFLQRQFTKKVGDVGIERLAGVLLQQACRVDGLLPVFFLHVDFQQIGARQPMLRGFQQLAEYLLGAVKQPGLQIILPQFAHRTQALVFGQAFALKQVFVHADGAVEFATAAKQATQRKVQVDGLGFEFDDFEKGFDGLVRLLVEQKIQPAEIRIGQRARFGHHLANVDPRRQPAQHEKQGERQQPPELEFHGVRRQACRWFA